MLLPLAVLRLAAVAAAAGPSLYSGYNFNPLEHLGGVAPYFEPQDPPTDPAPPRGCTPMRAAYLVRHAAIFANDFDYEEYIEPFIAKWQNHTAINWSAIPGLSFLATWTPPISDAELELLTRVGRLEAAQLGTAMAFRYPNLRLPPRRVWASSAERTTESARALARALQLRDDQQAVTLVNVSESVASGADNLTPYKACPGYSASAGSEQSGAFLDQFAGPVADRLNGLVSDSGSSSSSSSFDFDAKDIYGMMALCGYESVIRGRSSFCDTDLFAPDEWLGWEYAADVMYHYNVGYGSPVTGAIGLPWLNATADLLMASNSSSSSTGDSGDEQQDLYVSFTHRELPPAVLVAMGLFNNSAFSGGGDVNLTMPADRINQRRAWRSSHMLPFLGNIALERLQCNGSAGFADGEYYRALVNNAPQELPDCGDGPGTSCSRAGFETYLSARVQEFPHGFAAACGVDSGNASGVLTIYTDPGQENGTVVKRREVWG